jgi:mono/diheme cytochrome c family protein
MKRLVVLVIATLGLIAFAAAGCGEQLAVSPGEGQQVFSSCVECHTDKDTLKEVASPEPGEEKSEASSGEG